MLERARGCVLDVYAPSQCYFLLSEYSPLDKSRVEVQRSPDLRCVLFVRRARYVPELAVSGCLTLPLPVPSHDTWTRFSNNRPECSAVVCPCFRRRRTGDTFCLSHFESPREPTTVVWSFCGVAERDTKRPHALSYLFCRAVFACCSRPPRLGIYLMCIPISRRPSLAGQGVRNFQGNPGGCKGCPRPLVSTTPMSKIKLGPMSGRVLPWEVIGQVANAARIWHSTSDLSLNAGL